jgi:hypothetical protein
MADTTNNTTGRDWFGYGASGLAGAALAKASTGLSGLRLTEPLNLKMISKVPGVARTVPGAARLLPGMGVASTGGVISSIALPVYLTKKLADWRASNLDSQYQGNHLRLLNELGGNENNPEENEGDNLAISLVNHELAAREDAKKAQMVEAVKAGLPTAPTLETLKALTTPEVGSSDSAVLTGKGDFTDPKKVPETVTPAQVVAEQTGTIAPTATVDATGSVSVGSVPSSGSVPSYSGGGRSGRSSSRRTRVYNSGSTSSQEALDEARNEVDGARRGGMNWPMLLMALSALGGAYYLGRR